jgi:hypothetical protein
LASRDLILDLAHILVDAFQCLQGHHCAIVSKNRRHVWSLLRAGALRSAIKAIVKWREGHFAIAAGIHP